MRGPSHPLALLVPLGLVLLLGACGAAAPTPSASPAPSSTSATTTAPSSQPTIAPTGTPSPNPTATPAPTLPPFSPISLSDYLDGLLADVATGGGTWPEVDGSAVSETISSLLTSHPELQNQTYGESGQTYPDFFQRRWDQCQNGDPDFGGDEEENKVIGCGFVAHAFYNTYVKARDDVFLDALGELLAWTQENLEDPEAFISELR